MTDVPTLSTELAGLFERTSETSFAPTELCRGPWRADAQHGGPPSALLGHLSQPHVEEGEFLSFIEIELVRPVPLVTLVGSAERVRVSGRVHRVLATISAGGEVVARSNALVLKTTDLATPEWTPDLEVAVDPPDESFAVEPPRWASGDVTSYHRNAVEHRFTSGTFREAGPAIDWMRLRQPVIVGEEPTGLERVLAAADFGSGISAVYGPASKVGLINANLAVSFVREHVGEWVSLDATTHVGHQGTGLGVTSIGDSNGVVGVATQSLLGYTMKS